MTFWADGFWADGFWAAGFWDETALDLSVRDRRYKVNKYGDGALYGASIGQSGLAWDVSIDWDGDGTLESNEANRLQGISIQRGRTRLLGGFGAGFETVQTGECSLVLTNTDGRFDGWNTESPLYPNVNYGKEVRIRVKDLNTGIIYPRFYGIITNIEPSGYDSEAVVNITLSDALDYLRNNTARVAIQAGATPDEAMGLILDAAGWRSRWGRDLDVSVQTMPYWWSSGNKSALSELEDLALSFFGYFFVDATGQARYISRTNVSASVADCRQSELMKDIGNPQPYEIRRNVTRLKVHPLTLASTGTIWELVGEAPSISTSLSLFANYSYNNTPVSALNVITPVGGTDFTVNSLPDGSGTDLTASCTATLTDFGDTAKLVIRNNSGSGGYLTLLKIRGDALYEPNVTDVTYPTDLTSIPAPRELLFDLRWMQDVNIAIDLATVLGPFYAGLHPMPNIKINSRPELQYAAELFDIVTVSIPKIGISGESFRVGGIEEKSSGANCQNITTRLFLEPYISSDDFMQWDTNSVWDSSTVFGW